MKGSYDKDRKTTRYPIESWVIMKNETRQKLDPKFLGPHRIVYHGPFYTYKLMTTKGDQLKVLVNHNRLQPANVENPDNVKPWTKTQGRRDKNDSIFQMRNDVI
ncbi:hypothetical protein AYI69_g4824 [Smittium culicis]|uniref:Uncharacterized protein n=1 Tax=Smittium culicis TaxID=133412 RepID=A0A1R1YAC6_9FUNG|nr:hypothetical protein AYI69_g4824 [Smittium culicis]